MKYVLGCQLSVDKISYSSNQGGSQEEHISLITIMFCFDELAFTVQVKHKINSTQILGFILISLYFTTGHIHTCTFQRMQPISLLILGSVLATVSSFMG